MTDKVCLLGPHPHMPQHRPSVDFRQHFAGKSRRGKPNWDRGRDVHCNCYGKSIKVRAQLLKDLKCYYMVFLLRLAPKNGKYVSLPRQPFKGGSISTRNTGPIRLGELPAKYTLVRVPRRTQSYRLSRPAANEITGRKALNLT
jgi:hypothetical protein